LSVVPRIIRLVFNEKVELAVSRLSLTGPNGLVQLGALRLDPDSANILFAEVTAPLVSGAYRINWQVVGSDGHPVRGEVPFTITPDALGVSGTDAAPLAPGVDSIPPEHHAQALQAESGFDAQSPLYAAVRWLTFGGLLALIGVVAFRVLVLGLVSRNWEPAGTTILAPAASRATTVGLVSIGILAVALFLRLYAQSYALHGPQEVLNPGPIGTMLSRTLWGWGWLLQLAGSLVALAGLLLARRNKHAGWTLTALGAIALAFTPGLSGHAAAERELTAVAILADGLHVLGAGGWLGTLLIVLLVGVPVALRRTDESRGAAVAALINAFSPTALFFAGMVVVTGTVSAWLQLGSMPALWQSAYGRILLLKLAVLVLVFGTGAYNWLKVRPALGSEVAAQRLRRSATFELAVGVVVLAITAVLTATPPPAEEITPSVSTSAVSN